MQVSESSMLHCHMASSNCMFNLSGGSKCGYKNILLAVYSIDESRTKCKN